MTVVDWIALAVVLLAAAAGMRRGLLLSAFSLAGLAVGAYVGSRVAPHLLSGGSSSLWTGVAGLVGAVIGAGLLQILAVVAASYLRGGIKFKPLRAIDSAGGLALGAVTGLALVWVAAAVVTRSPRPMSFRSDVERSWIVRKLDAVLPPRDLLGILESFDPFPSITGPSAPTLPPSVGVVRNPRIRASLTRVVKVLGTACGRGVEGSGWFARGDLVVTAAHVVAGERTTIVEIPGDSTEHAATVVVFDPHNDIAVLRVAGAMVQPLPLADPVDGASAAIAGYPLDGSLTAVPGRVGATANAFTEDAYRHRVERAITAVAGSVEHGDSGGPVIDTSGVVVGTVFAAKKPDQRSDPPSGYAVPASIIRTDLAQARRHAVSTQRCAP